MSGNRGEEDEEMLTDPDTDDEQESDDEEAKKNEAEIAQLKEALRANPYDYDKYLPLIELLTTSGELDDLRQIRETFAKHYPLAPDIWLAWISDEEKLASTPEEKESVAALFEQAVTDYVSVDVWQEYCQFSIWQMGVPDGPKNIRGVFERALVAVGVHVPKGNLIWETYREFEIAILSGDPTNEEQKSRVDKLFRRQLAVPLTSIDVTYEEYKLWLKSDTVDPNVERNYKAAKELLKSRQVLEDRLQSLEDVKGSKQTKMAIYEEYIALEKKEGNPVRIKNIFELRATEFCLEPRVWLEYSDYLEKSLKDLENSKNVLLRAVRNCPWTGQLWVQLIRCCERLNVPKVEVCKHLETGLVSTTEILNLWLAFIDYRRRGLSTQQDDDDRYSEKDQEEMRTLFRRALDHLASVSGDPECKIARYWASIEADRFQDMEKARQIWAEITMGPAGEKAQFWVEYINLEKMFGDTKHLKKLFPRALSKTMDSPSLVGEMWIQFEREDGSLDSLEDAEKKVQTKLEELRQTLKAVAPKSKTFQKKPNPNLESVSPKERKRKPPIQTGPEEPVFKKPMLATPSTSKQSSSPSTKSGIKPPPGFKPPPGYKPDPPIASPSAPAVDGGAKATGSAKDAIARSIFVSNLSYEFTEDQLKTLLSSSGPIEAIRLVSNYSGKSKGFAYVTFETMEGRQLAMKRDREPIDGRPMYISENDPEKKHQFQYSTEMEMNKLFVKGLPQTATKEEVEKVFSPYGTLKEVRMITFRNGHFKGIAYVVYQSAKDAKTAVVKLDNYDFNGYTISVAISNPPARKEGAKNPQQGGVGKIANSLGGGGSNVPSKGPRGRGRTQLSFVPAALQKRSTPATNGKPKPENGSSTAGNGSSGQAMSNADFRKMMLK